MLWLTWLIMGSVVDWIKPWIVKFEVVAFRSTKTDVVSSERYTYHIQY